MISGVRFHNRFALALTMVLMFGFTVSASAQEPEGRPAQSEAPPPAGENAKPFPETSSDLIKALAQQVRDLTIEVGRLRRTLERNDLSMELLLSEEKLARLEDNISACKQRGAELDASERVLNYRQDHVNDEVVLSARLDRQEAEAAVRADIEQRFQAVHDGRAANQQRMASLELEASKVRKHIQELQRAIAAADRDKADRDRDRDRDKDDRDRDDKTGRPTTP